MKSRARTTLAPTGVRWPALVLATNALVGIGVAIGAAWILLAQTRPRLQVDLERRSQAACAAAALQLRYAATVGDPQQAASILGQLGLDRSVQVETAALQSEEGEEVGRFVRPVAPGHPGKAADGKVLRVACPVASLSDSESRAGTLTIAVGTLEIDAEMKHTWMTLRPMAAVLCGALVLQLVIALFVIRRLQSARRRVEDAHQQVLQAGKLAAVGQLAAGVAHEINNPLGVILGFAQSMERRVPEGAPLRLPVTSIVRESIRCKNLVQELLTFSRVSTRVRDEQDLNEMIAAASVLLEARARTQGVTIVQDLEAGLEPVLASRTQVEQVLVNLGTNAMDVMPSGGTLTIRTCAEGRDRIRLEVSDTGPGVPADIRGKIFDPFFTTKPVGKGTGLGLSLVYEITRQHGGEVELADQPGPGATFVIRFPVRPQARNLRRSRAVTLQKGEQS